jgi:hypothetical protein
LCGLLFSFVVHPVGFVRLVRTDAIRGKKFEDDEEVISKVKKWLRQRPAEWKREGIQALTSRWRKAIDSAGSNVTYLKF